MDIEDQWLSVEGAAHYFDVSTDTIYKWIKEYNMPCCRIGRLLRFKPKQIDAWAESNFSVNGEDREND